MYDDWMQDIVCEHYNYPIYFSIPYEHISLGLTYHKQSKPLAA